jgi:ubiquitin-protein ligase
VEGLRFNAILMLFDQWGEIMGTFPQVVGIHLGKSTFSPTKMASSMATNRLRKEYVALQRKPVENIRAAPLEKNILEWHYVITGTEGTPYEGGYYHGKLKFPPEYPMKPPSIMMITPNGRFEVNRGICLSMSDFHPETWNPLWTVGSILTGLYSFMVRKTPSPISFFVGINMRICMGARSWTRRSRPEALKRAMMRCVGMGPTWGSWPLSTDGNGLG